MNPDWLPLELFVLLKSSNYSKATAKTSAADSTEFTANRDPCQGSEQRELKTYRLIVHFITFFKETGGGLNAQRLSMENAA